MIGSRRFFGSQGPLNFRVVRIPPGGINYLLDFSEATFTRASEASFVDPREGWAFMHASEWTEFINFDDDLTAWTPAGTPVVVGTGIADPHGGTLAGSAEDDDSAGFEGITSPAAPAMRIGQRLRVTFYVGKDADETRFPEIQIRDSSGGHQYYIDINTSTGASAERVDVQWLETSHTVTSHDANWWKVVALVTSTTTNTFQLKFFPAMGTSLGTANGPAVGTTNMFVDPIEMDLAWVPDDVPRIFNDGTILIEGTRTNQVTYFSDFAEWSAITEAPEITGSVFIAPDGGSAQEVKWIDGPTLGELRDAYASDIDVDLNASWYLTRGAGSGSADVTTGLRDQVGTQANTTRTVTEEWTRFADTQNAASGGNTPITRLIENSGDTGASFGVWGAQFELGAFASSIIRTSGAIATRAVDVMSYADNTILDTGKWSVTATPNHNYGDIPDAALKIILSRNTSTYALYIRDQGVNPRVVLSAGGVLLASVIVGAWTAHTELTFIVDWNARELTISGFPSGNGTFAFASTESWSDLGTTILRVGSSNAGGGAPFDGVISRPIGL